MKNRLLNLTLFELDSAIVLSVSKFVRLAREKHDAELKLTDADIIFQVYKLGKQTEDARLRLLFLKIRRGIAKYLESVDSQTQSSTDVASVLPANKRERVSVWAKQAMK